MKIIPEYLEKKKRFGLKLREKDLVGKIGKEKIRLFAVIAFFFVSGVFYSHGFYGEKFVMGEEISVEELGTPAEAEVYAEELMGKLNINTASEQELIRLPDIGEKRAADIIAYREANGGFHRIEDIMDVFGIGEKTFEEIKESITVGE